MTDMYELKLLRLLINYLTVIQFIDLILRIMQVSYYSVLTIMLVQISIACITNYYYTCTCIMSNHNMSSMHIAKHFLPEK